MSREITADGQVIAPLNITVPAPLLNLRGFKWETIENDVPATQGASHDEKLGDGQPAAGQAPLHAQAPHFTSKRAVVPPPAATPAAAATPALAAAPQDLPGVLKEQIFHPSEQTPPPTFPLAQFQGSYAGNGFNLIFRPRPNSDTTKFEVTPDPGNLPADNILELNLTTEQLSFGPTLGDIPNRGLFGQDDIHLQGIPYLQTVQDVSNNNGATPKGIHFEPGVWLVVPPANFQTGADNLPSVVRMASIPHGTTINAQGLVKPATVTKDTPLGGVKGGPKFGPNDTTPFFTVSKQLQPFPSMKAEAANTLRIPQNLKSFIEAKTITTDIIKNPHIVLENAIKGLDIKETITFEVTTESSPPTAPKLNAGGISNIAFLMGPQDKPVNATTVPAVKNANAHAAMAKSTFWIERVAYQVNVPRVSGQTVLTQLRPTMPPGSTAPTPVFNITTPPGGIPAPTTITVEGLQIQYSQTVHLNFAPLTWPHVSVATLAPTNAQPWVMK